MAGKATIAVLNQATVGSTLIDEAREAIAGYDVACTLVVVHHRLDHVRAFTEGLTAGRQSRDIVQRAEIAGQRACSRGLRHNYGAAAVFGHASITTTAIGAEAPSPLHVRRSLALRIRLVRYRKPRSPGSFRKSEADGFIFGSPAVAFRSELAAKPCL